MFRGCVRWLLACLLVLLSIASAHAVPASSEPAMVRLPGHVLPALTKATVVPSKPESNAQPITLTIVLKRDNEAGFTRHLHDIYDPHSKYFHHYLSQSQIADRFGPSQRDYDLVLDYLRANGFTLVQSFANRLTLTARGTRSQAEKAFDIKISDYRIQQRTFFANDRAPALPEPIAAHIETITGLSNAAQPHHATRWLFNTVCDIEENLCKAGGGTVSTTEHDACHNAANQGNSYGSFYFCAAAMPPPTKSSAKSPASFAQTKAAVLTPWPDVTGAGQKIGLVEFDTFVKSDVVDYLALTGEPHRSSIN